MAALDVLAARAKRLAERTEHTDVMVEATSLLVVRLGAERFALAIKALRSVVPIKKLTIVPGADPRIAGLMAVNGEVHCVLDLARLLGLDAALAGDGYALVLKRAGAQFALRVGQIESVDALAANATATTVGSDQRRYVRLGSGESVIVIEDLNTLLGPFIQGDQSS